MDSYLCVTQPKPKRPQHVSREVTVGDPVREGRRRGGGATALRTIGAGLAIFAATRGRAAATGTAGVRWSTDGGTSVAGSGAGSRARGAVGEEDHHINRGRGQINQSH